MYDNHAWNTLTYCCVGRVLEEMIKRYYFCTTEIGLRKQTVQSDWYLSGEPRFTIYFVSFHIFGISGYFLQRKISKKLDNRTTILAP